MTYELREYAAFTDTLASARRKGQITCNRISSKLRRWTLRKRRRHFDSKVIWAARGWVNSVTLVIGLLPRASALRSIWLAFLSSIEKASGCCGGWNVRTCNCEIAPRSSHYNLERTVWIRTARHLDRVEDTK